MNMPGSSMLLVVEQRLPIGCILHCSGDILCIRLGSGSQRQPIPLAALDGQIVLSDHDLRSLGPGHDGRHPLMRWAQPPSGPGSTSRVKLAPLRVAVNSHSSANPLPLASALKITIPYHRRPFGRAHRFAEPFQQRR